MCVDEVEGEVVVNLLQGEIRIEDGWRDFGLPNRNIYVYGNVAIFSHNNNRAITG